MSHKIVEVKARDGALIPCGVWGTRGDVILYLHGIESHMGWFKDMAEKFQERGTSVYALDRRGSGLSKEERGHIDSYKTLLNDIDDVIKDIKKSHPEDKLYLTGMCGGGRFAADFAGLAPAAIDGLILISPAIKTKVTLPVKDKLDVLFNSFLNPKKRVPTPLEDGMFTDNEKYLDFIKNDALNLHHLTARFYRELILMDIMLSNKIFKIDIPILTLLAGDDAIVNNDAMKRWHQRLKASDKTIKVFSGCCHFLPFQENVDDIVSFITEWISERKRRN